MKSFIIGSKNRSYRRYASRHTIDNISAYNNIYLLYLHLYFAAFWQVISYLFAQSSVKQIFTICITIQFHFDLDKYRYVQTALVVQMLYPLTRYSLFDYTQCSFTNVIIQQYLGGPWHSKGRNPSQVVCNSHVHPFVRSFVT